MDNANVDSGKRFLIIGAVIAAAILIFTAAFLYFSSNEMAEMEEQLSQLNDDYKTAMEETNQYTSSMEDEDIAGTIKEIQAKGNEVAEIQNKMIKYDFEHNNPIDAPSEDALIDKATRKQMKSLFSADDKQYTDGPWLVGKDLKCKFNPIFQYRSTRVPVIWIFESDGRVAALAVASYDKTTKVFEDLTIYKTMFGTSVTEEAYNLMVERVTGKSPADEQFDDLDVVDESEEPEGTMVFDDEGEDIAPDTNTNQETTENGNSEEGE